MKSFALCCALFCTVLSARALAQNQSEMNQEAAQSFAQADKELNKVYAKVLGKLDDEARAKLKAAQRAWLGFRDAEAAFQADVEARGGSMAPLIYEGTRARLTKARLAELRAWIEEHAGL